MSHRVRRGQVYESCLPSVVDGKEDRTRIRVVADPHLMVGAAVGKVPVVTILPDGREGRPRALEVSRLHATAYTATGQPRRTGYALLAGPTPPDPSEEGSTR